MPSFRVQLTKLPQTAMIKYSSFQIDGAIASIFELDWRILKFHERLGSGSFGDCFKVRTRGCSRFH